jgi:flagellar biosynthesis regulator FlbT
MRWTDVRVLTLFNAGFDTAAIAREISKQDKKVITEAQVYNALAAMRERHYWLDDQKETHA